MPQLRGEGWGLLAASIHLTVVASLKGGARCLLGFGGVREAHTCLGRVQTLRVRRIGAHALFLHVSAGQRRLVVEVWVGVLEGMGVGRVVVAGMAVVASVVVVVRVLVVADPLRQANIFLHVRGEEDGVPSPLFQHVQWGHLRSGQAVYLQFRGSRGLEVPEVSQRRQQVVGVRVLGVGLPTPSDSGDILRQAMQEQARLHSLHLLGLLFAPGPVFVVGVVLQVLQPEPLCFLYKWPLVHCAQGLPGLT